MKEGNVTLNTKEQRRLMILNQLGSGSLASQEGAGLLGISERQLRRLRRAYEERGAAALAHGNRGRAPVNVVTASVRQQVVMLATVQRKGVPLAIYSDRHGIFFKTKSRELSLEEQLDGRRQPTQFARLLEELGIQLILARSPQAKGRVERLWGRFQDRLASELRLAGASCLDEAQRVLEGFLPRHNRRFRIAPNDPTPAWLPAPDRRRFDQLFCFK